MAVFLQERLSFDTLFRYSEPKRVYRSFTVRGPPLEIDSYQDSEYYIFNFKSNPSTTGLRHRGYVKFFRPLHKDPAKVPLQHLECLVDCMCFSGDTLVHMGDGTYKPIKDVKIGDEVYTHKGRLRKVTNTNVRAVKPDENVYTVKVEGFPGNFKVTGDHPFYTFRPSDICACGCGNPLTSKSRFESRTMSPELMESRKFLHGHHRKLVSAIMQGKDVVLAKHSDFKWINVSDFRPQEWFLSPWLEEGGDATVNPDFARLVGYYVAEGCIPNWKLKNSAIVRLTFNLNEWDTLGADVLSLCAKFGFKAERRKCRRNANSKYTWFDVIIENKKLRDYCECEIGRGSKVKRLSKGIMNWDNEALKGLFTGALLGDGWRDPVKGMKFLSTNFNLATQMATILARLKIRYNVSLHGKERPITTQLPQHYTQTAPEMFQVVVPRGESAKDVRHWTLPFLRKKDSPAINCKNVRRNAYNRNEGQLRPMMEREKILFSGSVYDLTVAEDESFVVHGIAVHNCPDFRYRFAWSLKQRGSSIVGPQSLNQAWNKAPRKTNPSNKISLCKHLLAAREYIYGVLSSFPGDEPDTAYKLDKLTKHATKRWTDFEGQMQAARTKEVQIRKRREMRNIGQDPDKITEPVQPVEPAPEEISAKELEEVPGEEMEPEPLPALELAKPPGQRGRGIPSAPAKPELAVPPGMRGRNFPTSSPIKQPKSKRVIGNRKVRPINPGENGWIRPQEMYLCQPIRNFILENVITSNGENMSTIKEAIKLVEEMEEDELNRFDPETQPADFDSGGGGGGDMSMDDGVMGGGETLEPSEPPVSDSAMGADTEGESALSLLRSIKVSLEQIAAAVAPIEEMPPEGMEGGPGGGGGAGGDIPMPDEPPADIKASEDEFEGAEDEEAAEGDEEAAREKEGEAEEEEEEAAAE